MKFLIDENLPYSLKQVIENFSDVIHVRDVGLLGRPDSEVFSFILKEEVALITRDLEFGNPQVYPQDSHHGIVILRVPPAFTVQEIIDLVGKATPFINEPLNNTVIITPRKIRRRQF